MRALSLYAFAQAKAKTLAGFLLSSLQEDALRNAHDLNEAMQVLLPTWYHDPVTSFLAHQNLRRFEKDIVQGDIDILLKLIKSLHHIPREIMVLILRRYEIAHLKAVLRLWKKPDDADEQIPYLYNDTLVDYIPVKEIIFAESLDEIMGLLHDTPYRDVLASASVSFYATGKLFFIEMALDRWYYEQLWQKIVLLSKKDRACMQMIVGMKIDIENIRLVLRMRPYAQFLKEEGASFFIPHGYAIDEQLFRMLWETADYKKILQKLAIPPYNEIGLLIMGEFDQSRLHILDAVMWQIFMRQVKRIFRGYPFYQAVIVSYFLCKSAETAFVISSLYSVQYGRTSEERVRQVGWYC